MKPLAKFFDTARTRPMFMLVCSVAIVAAPMLLSAYLDVLDIAVQRGESLRQLQRAGGAVASGSSDAKPPAAQFISNAGRVSRAVRAS